MSTYTDLTFYQNKVSQKAKLLQTRKLIKRQGMSLSGYKTDPANRNWQVASEEATNDQLTAFKEHDMVEIIGMCEQKYHILVRTFSSTREVPSCVFWVECPHLDLMTGWNQENHHWFQPSYVYEPYVPNWKIFKEFAINTLNT